jgi:hypothetical protein
MILQAVPDIHSGRSWDSTLLVGIHTRSCRTEAGHTFWEKLGFHLVGRHPHPELQDRSQFVEFVTTLEEQAKSIGLPPKTARDLLVMRLDLT